MKLFLSVSVCVLSVFCAYGMNSFQLHEEPLSPVQKEMQEEIARLWDGFGSKTPEEQEELLRKSAERWSDKLSRRSNAAPKVGQVGQENKD